MSFYGDQHLSLASDLNDLGVPFVFMYWEPSALISEDWLLRVTLPINNPECAANNTFSLDGLGSVDCDFYLAPLNIHFPQTWENSDTYKDAVSFINAVTFGSSDYDFLPEVGR